MITTYGVKAEKEKARMEALIFFFLHAFYFLECNDWYVTSVVMVCFWIVMFFGRFVFWIV
jgi:hypothetical protein